jgi:hypothetical protein
MGRRAGSSPKPLAGVERQTGEAVSSEGRVSFGRGPNEITGVDQR